MKAIHLTACGHPAQSLKIVEVSEPKELTQTALAANRRRFVPQERVPSLAGCESKHPGCS